MSKACRNASLPWKRFSIRVRCSSSRSRSKAMPKADLRERYVGMSLEAVLPSRRRLYYGGDWHDGERGEMALASPSDGRSLGHVALAGVGDVDAAVDAAHAGFSVWKDVPPFERGR